MQLWRPRLTQAAYLRASVVRFILSVRPWLHFLQATLFGLAFAFLAVATTGPLLSLTECTQPGDELGLPCPEVGFDAAMFAFSHVAVALPSHQHAMSTELPEPPINIFANLQEKDVDPLNQVLRQFCGKPRLSWGPGQELLSRKQELSAKKASNPQIPVSTQRPSFYRFWYSAKISLNKGTIQPLLWVKSRKDFFEI